jgi:DNA polymerase
MSPREELLEIVGQLKNLLISYPENGVDLPRLSSQSVSDAGVGQSPPTDLNALRAFIGDCKRCKLSEKRTRIVFGEGSPKARLVFVGEGPGAEEDAAGRPFVGEAGKLLTRIIEGGMGLKREDVYICNVVKCRPPNNRDPESDEVQTCLPFLKQQLAIIRPEVICTLGRIAAQSLLGREFKVTQERGKWFSFMETPLMATFHPAYILRNPSEERQLKRAVWEDVQKIMKRLGLKVKKNE